MTTLRIPGPLDPHVHLRGLDWKHKGTMHSETSAALAGGYSAVLDMPNAVPTTTSAAGLARKREELAHQAVCDWGIYYGAHPDGNAETFPAAMPHVIGLKIYCDPTTGDLFLTGEARERHFAAWREHGLVAVHAEEEEVAAMLELVDAYGVHTHFCHISTGTELSLLRKAKERDLPISVGVCPHHLYLTVEDRTRLGPRAWMKPPLKTHGDREALWSALLDGLVDVVESDHAPHAWDEKQAASPAYGVPGLETTLPLLGSEVVRGRITPERLIELTSSAPRRIFGIPCPDDTWTELELGVEGVIEGARMKALCGWTPFEGFALQARVSEVRLRGQTAYDGENVRVPPGYGQPVTQVRERR